MQYDDEDEDEDKNLFEDDDDPLAPLVNAPEEDVYDPVSGMKVPSSTPATPEQEERSRSFWSDPIKALRGNPQAEAQPQPADDVTPAFDFAADAVKPRVPAVPAPTKISPSSTNTSVPSGRSAREKLYQSQADAETKQIDQETGLVKREADANELERQKQETALFNKRLKLDQIGRQRDADLQNYQQQVNARVAQLEEIASAPQSKVDVDRHWNNMSTGGKVLATLGALMGSRADGPDAVQRAINDDIAKQEMQIKLEREGRAEKKNAIESLLEINQRKFNTEQEARAVTELQLINRYNDELEAAKLKAGSERNLIALERAQAGLEKRKSDVLNQLQKQKNDEAERAAAANAAAAQKRAEAEQLARMGIHDIRGKLYKMTGVDERGQPILSNLGEGGAGKASEESMKLNATIAATDTIVKDLNGIDPNTKLPETSDIVTRNVHKLKEEVAGTGATSLSPDQVRLQNARQAAMGMYARLRESGVINEGERPDIERALRGNPRQLAFALSAMNDVTKAKRKARGD